MVIKSQKSQKSQKNTQKSFHKTITVNSIYLSKPENITFVVFNRTYILLNWNVNNSSIYSFANPRESRYTISVYYNIYREDADTNNTTLIGTTNFSTFTDTTATNFNNYNYRRS